ncbi:MAG: putative TrmH family tRNA/rRNA methyltransferase [Acidimicrobiales bacterium]|nr:putative TrmH family tRNA/rRNA methyltransferase [Acidimicrobiales bacterium]
MSRRPPGGRGAAGRGSPRPRGGARSAGGKRQSRRDLDGRQVEGRQAVRELLIAGKRRTKEILLDKDAGHSEILDDIVELAAEARVPVREVSRSRIAAECRTDAPQGVIARADPLREVDIEVLCSGANRPFLVAFDGVTDPGNLGAALRSAECAGATGAILPRHRAVHITPVAAKAAAGAIEYLPMALAGGLPAALSRLADSGVWILGLDETGTTSLFDLSIAGEAVCLVLGSEGRGLSRLVRQRCDEVVAIPLEGNISSLNVAAAGTLACFEVTRRRGGPAVPGLRVRKGC